MATTPEVPEKKAPAKKAPAKKPAAEKAAAAPVVEPKPVAAKKAPVEREIVQVRQAPTQAEAKAATAKVGNRKVVHVTAETKKSALPWRIVAIVLWVLALGAMLGGIWMWMQGATLFNHTEGWLFFALGAAAVLCLAGSFVWKHGNSISPCTVVDDGSFGAKLKIFFWNQMGVVATFIVFLPIGLLLILRSDKLSAKAKQLLALIAVVLVALVAGLGANYNAPVAMTEDQISAEELQQKVAAGEVEMPENLTGDLNGAAYWTQYGKSYHFDQNCRTIMLSSKIFAGTLADAVSNKKYDACDVCADGASQQKDVNGNPIVSELTEAAQQPEAAEEAAAEETEATEADAPAAETDETETEEAPAA